MNTPFVFTFALVILYLIRRTHSVKCYKNYCKCTGEAPDEHLRDVDKTMCGCNFEGLGFVEECKATRSDYIAGCQEFSMFNHTGQVKERDCLIIRKNEANSRSLQCKSNANAEPEDNYGLELELDVKTDIVECTCFEDLCNKIFSNAFSKFEDVSAFSS